MPSVGCVVGYLLCFWLLGKALVTVNLSVGYAIWALGIVLTSIIAVVMFGGQLNVPSIVGIALIVAGVVLVNMFGPAH